MTDRDIFLIEVSRRGRDGDYTGASEVAALDTRVDALEARPNITSLDAVPGVDAAAPSAGQILLFDGLAWEPRDVPVGVNVFDHNNNAVVYFAQSLYVRDGLTAVAHATDPTIAYLRPRFAGTGVDDFVARSDHTHTTPSVVVATFAPSGYLSGGSRPLASTSVVLAAGVSYLVQTRLNMQIRGADAGQCYYRLALTVDGSTHESPAGTNGFWCVQGVPDKTMWMYPRTIVGTGAAISISAAVSYHSGGGFNTDAGEIEVTLIPNK